MSRVRPLQRLLSERGLPAMLITGSANLFYTIGLPASDAAALILSSGPAYYLTDPRFLDADDLRTEDLILRAACEDEYCGIINELLSHHGVNELGYEESYVSHGQFTALTGSISARLIPSQALLSAMRAVKAEEEISCIKRAQRITELAFEDVLHLLSTDMSEKDVAAELTYRMLRHGADGMAFDPVVASGVRTCLPHAMPSARRLSPGPLLIDIGCRWEGYCSDMTRTVFLGEPTEEMRHIYSVVQRAMATGIAAAGPATFSCAVDSAARQVISSAGYGADFIHAFGHGVGIEVHELPLAAPGDYHMMRPGNILTAEPGIYLDGCFGVRLEDMLLITDTGCLDLTNASRDLQIIT